MRTKETQSCENGADFTLWLMCHCAAHLKNNFSQFVMHVPTESARMVRCLSISIVLLPFRKHPMFVPRSPTDDPSWNNNSSRTPNPDQLFLLHDNNLILLIRLHNMFKGLCTAWTECCVMWGWRLRWLTLNLINQKRFQNKILGVVVSGTKRSALLDIIWHFPLSLLVGNLTD